jgi:hypothetical protein
MPSDPVATPLSIVIACREPWPAIRCALDALYPQVTEVGAEIIVAMSDRGIGHPEAQRWYPGVTWLPGQRDDSVFRLRALAVPRCRGEIIALTEDHARVEPDWCRAIIDAHAQYPAAAAIGGVVENGAAGSLANWAGFFVANGRFMRPILNGASGDISLQANVAYKRGALPQCSPELGPVQSILHYQLRQRGAQLIATDRMVAHHVQELTLGGHSAIHFHNARATAAFMRDAAANSPWLLGYAILVPKLMWQTFATAMRKGRYRRELIIGSPLIAWLICCHAAGELLGRLRGPGRNSPRGVG